MRNLIIAGVLIIIGLVVLSQSLYKVDEKEQVLVTRFGDVKSVHRTAATPSCNSETGAVAFSPPQ